jgi:hypothetical protein
MTHSRIDETRTERAGRTLAQTFCLAFGITLVAVGVLGFAFGGTNFDIGAGVEGEEFIVFEVNGWHNLVHIASGLLLLAAAPNGRMAASTAIGFGLVYALVTVWGFIDGNDVFGLIPVNTADNFLHLALTVAALFAGLASRGLIDRGAQSREHPPVKWPAA